MNLPALNQAYRILVVEDDVQIRRANIQSLRASGYDVQGAENGAGAWALLQTNTFDLLITDNNMPQITGVELLEKLDAIHLPLPVIMATGTLPQAEFTRQPWLRPALTLLKPYSRPQLLGAVQQIFARSTAGPAKP